MADEYSKAAQLTLDGIPVLEIEEAEMGIKTNDNGVITLGGGLVGFSDGANVCEFSFKSAIPLAGREIDYFDLARKKVTKTWGMKMGGKSRKVRGRFMDVKESSSPNSPNAISGSFSGKYIDA